MSAPALGPRRSDDGTCDVPAKCVLTAKFAPAGYQKEDYLGSGDGLHEWKRDSEYGMVAVYEFYDIEYRSCHWTGRVVGHRDGSGDTSVEGIDISFSREEEFSGGTMCTGPLFFYRCVHSVGVWGKFYSSIALLVHNCMVVSDTKERVTDSEI